MMVVLIRFTGRGAPDFVQWNFEALITLSRPRILKRRASHSTCTYDQIAEKHEVLENEVFHSEKEYISPTQEFDVQISRPC
jgi:hypothetical protein